MKQKSTSPDQTENQELTTEEFYKKLGIPNATKKMEGKVRLSFSTKPTQKEEVLKTSSKELSDMDQDSSPKEEANKAVNKKQHYAVTLKPKVIELSQEDLEHLAEWLAKKYPQKP